MLCEKLPPPELRFNYSSTYARDILPKRGLYKFGPYDLELSNKDKIGCVVFYPVGCEDAKNVLVRGLTEGEDKFSGFEGMFKLPLEIIDAIAYSEEDVEILLQQISAQSVEIVYFILEKNRPELYRKSKLILLMSGVPSQMISVNTLRNQQGLQFVLENVSLSTYAKTGGPLWTKSPKENKND